jgi:hypothetical protein
MAANRNVHGEDNAATTTVVDEPVIAGGCIARSRRRTVASLGKAGGTGRLRACDEAVYKGRDLCSNYSLLVQPISPKASASSSQSRTRARRNETEKAKVWEIKEPELRKRPTSTPTKI